MMLLQSLECLNYQLTFPRMQDRELESAPGFNGCQQDPYTSGALL